MGTAYFFMMLCSQAVNLWTVPFQKNLLEIFFWNIICYVGCLEIKWNNWNCETIQKKPASELIDRIVLN